MQDKYASLRQQLEQLNHQVNLRQQATPGGENLRGQLTRQVGELVRAKELTDAQIKSWLEDRGVVAVDGSVNTYGGNYPNFITLFRALAWSTMGVQYHESAFFTPLHEQGYLNLRDLMEGGLSAENSAQQLKNTLLARMEIKVALNALREANPGLMLMDGGFLRYQAADSNLWAEFRREARAKGCLVVGVIEEVGTFQLASLLNLQLEQHGERIFDRELLFGNLHKGEWLKVSPGQEWKHDFYTCFGRLADHPQVTGFDFFPEDLSMVDQVIDYLYTITPSGSRGIPLWLDIIDNEVRITHQEAQLLIESTLDPFLVEKLFKAQRSRRDI